MTTQGWFATPIYVSQLEGGLFRNVQKELFEACDKIDFGQNPYWGRDTHELSADAFKDDTLSNLGCNLFLKTLDTHINHYLDSVHCKWDRTYHIGQSWFTKTNHLQYAHCHDHGASDVSGVYYLKTNQKDGNLYFKSLNKPLTSNYVFSCIPDEQELQAQEGLMALWPSMLEHGTKVNNTDHERISLSFNIKFIR